MEAHITIVTNSYSRSLGLVTRSLEHSLYHAESIEKLIFIDQNSPELKLPTNLLENPKLNHLNILTNCVSSARNSFEVPKNTEWLIFCDDDGYIDKNYFKEFYQLIKSNPEIEIVAGSIIRDDTFDFYSPRHKIGGDLNKFQNTKLLMGSNFAVKADVFKKLGGFDENFGAGSYWGSGEETDFCWKAYFNGIKMKFAPELKVYHIKPYAGDFNHSLKKAYFYGIGKGALVAKWLFREKKIIVVYELIEMIFVPIVQSILNLFTFKAKNSLINLSSLVGRFVGLLKFAFKK